MSFTSNNNLETQPSGQADWDTGLNSNFSIIDRGYHGKFTTAMAVATGDICQVLSGGLIAKFDPRSLSNRFPKAMAYKAVSSGATDYFLLRGIVNSISVWSGNIIPGKHVFASPTTVGFAVSSYSAAGFPAGLALRNDAIYFNPSEPVVPEQITQVQSLGPLAIGSTHHFTLDVGNRGFITRVEIVTSFNLFDFYLWSGSAKVNSEAIYATTSGGIGSTYYKDATGFPFFNTDTASPGMVFGSVAVNSGVSSGYFNLTVIAERMR